MKNMEKIGIFFSVILICGSLFFVIQTGFSNSKNISIITSNQTYPTPSTLLPSENVTNPPTAFTLVNQNTGIINERVILHEKGTLSTKTYKTFDFKDLGFPFIYPSYFFRITIKADQPVLGYAIDTEQVRLLDIPQNIPHYEPFSENVDAGLIKPGFFLEKITNSTKEFKAGGGVGTLTYVIDGRWMSYDPMFDNVQPFSYEIIITTNSTPILGRPHEGSVEPDSSKPSPDITYVIDPKWVPPTGIPYVPTGIPIVPPTGIPYEPTGIPYIPPTDIPAK